MNTKQSHASFGVQETGDQKKPGKGLLIACISGFAVLGVIIGLFFGHSMGAANSAKSSSPVLHPKADAGESKRDQAGKYIDPDDTDFSWNITDLANLELGTYSTSNLGTSIEDVVDEHGKALQGSYRRDLIDLEWGELDDYDQDEDSFYYRSIREMELAFKKEGDRYYLQNISYSGDYRKAKAAYMPSDYYDKLKVGDPKTGKGGVSYKEVIGDNAVSSLTVSAGEDIETDEVITKMRIRFNSSGSDEYKLTFVKQADGDFLLAKKGAD